MLSHYAKAAAESNPQLDQNEVNKVIDAVSTETGGIIADINISIGEFLNEIIVKVGGVSRDELVKVAKALVQEYLRNAVKNTPIALKPETVGVTQKINELIDQLTKQIIKSTNISTEVATEIVRQYLLHAADRIDDICEGFERIKKYSEH